MKVPLRGGITLTFNQLFSKRLPDSLRLSLVVSLSSQTCLIYFARLSLLGTALCALTRRPVGPFLTSGAGPARY